jgi:hypothetical protein
MVAFCGVLLLCGAVLFVTDFIQGFIVEARTAAAVQGAAFGLCALLLIGFFAL